MPSEPRPTLQDPGAEHVFGLVDRLRLGWLLKHFPALTCLDAVCVREWIHHDCAAIVARSPHRQRFCISFFGATAYLSCRALRSNPLSERNLRNNRDGRDFARFPALGWNGHDLDSAAETASLDGPEHTPRGSNGRPQRPDFWARDY